MLGTVKPKPNQVRGARLKESYRDFLGSHIIIHRIPDGKVDCESLIRVVCQCLSSINVKRVLSSTLFDSISEDEKNIKQDAFISSNRENPRYISLLNSACEPGCHAIKIKIA